MDAGASFPIFPSHETRRWSAPDLGFTRDRLVYVRKSGVPDLRWGQRGCETLFGGALRSARRETGEASRPRWCGGGASRRSTATLCRAPLLDDLKPLMSAS